MARTAIMLALGALFVFGCATTDHVDDANTGGGMTDGGEMMSDGIDGGDGDNASLDDAARMGLAVFRNDEGEIVCPVKGGVTTPQTPYGYWDYEGMRYYFCCQGCPLKFAANLEKYAKE